MKKYINKQTIISFILGAILFSGVVTFAENRTITAFYNNIGLRVNGQFIYTDVDPCIIEGRTMVPARFIAEALGASVSFNETDNCVDVVSNVTPEPIQPTPQPTITPEPTPQPTVTPIPQPVAESTPQPTTAPQTTPQPTAVPTVAPTPQATPVIDTSATSLPPDAYKPPPTEYQIPGKPWTSPATGITWPAR